ncbi:MAG: helix-turn-helix transcriptional regulator [Tumebacillaceae bacterium]
MLLDASMTIGERFKHIRTEKGFSQSELTEGICSKSVVSHLENDRAYPSASMFGKLAEKLGVPLREIMGMQEKQLEAGFQIEMVRVYIEKADYKHALELIEELDRREDLLEHQQIELLVCRAECNVKLGNFKKVIDELSLFVEQQKQQTVEDVLLCDIFNKLGNAHYRLNDFEKAYSAFEQGYRISLKLPEFGLVSARVTKNLGLTCNQLGFLTDARRYLEKAYEYYDRVSDIRGLANTLVDLAYATGNLEHMQRAREMYETLNMVVEANLAKQHYAFYVEVHRNFKKALEDFSSSTKVFEQYGQFGFGVYTQSRAAIACIEKGHVELAKQCLSNAEELMKHFTVPDDYHFADFYKARARYYLLMESFEKSIADAHKASEMCGRMGLIGESAESLQIVAKAYFEQGQYVSAFEISQQVIEMLRKNDQGGIM